MLKDDVNIQFTGFFGLVLVNMTSPKLTLDPVAYASVLRFLFVKKIRSMLFRLIWFYCLDNGGFVCMRYAEAKTRLYKNGFAMKTAPSLSPK